MSKTIAELRASKQAGRATWIYPLCLVGKINERFQAADAAVKAAVEERDQLEPPDPEKPDNGRSYGDGPSPYQQACTRVEEAVAARNAVRDEMEADLTQVRRIRALVRDFDVEPIREPSGRVGAPLEDLRRGRPVEPRLAQGAGPGAAGAAEDGVAVLGEGTGQAALDEVEVEAPEFVARYIECLHAAEH